MAISQPLNNNDMSEFSRILTNLGLAYGLMTKDQFVDMVAKYAHDHQLNEEKMAGIVERLFEELEITHKRRQADQMFDAFKKKKMSESPDAASLFEDILGGEARASAPGGSSIDVLAEMRSLRASIEKLTESLTKKSED